MSYYIRQPKRKPKRLPRHPPYKAVPSGIGDEGIVGNWLFYYLKGGDHLHDFSPYKNHGTINGAKFVDGRYGWALEFDGVDDYVKVLYNSSLDLGTTGTIGAWIKPFSGIGDQAFIVNKHGGWNEAGFLLSTITTDNIRFQWQADGDVILDSSNTITIGEWNQVWGVMDGSEMRIYINGEEDPNTQSNTENSNYTEYLSIGYCLWQDGKPFKGLIKLARVYEEAKSASFISRRFEREKGIFGL